MSAPRYRNNDQKEFAKDFDILCRTRARYQVWSDFVHMAAYSISNAVDETHREARESEYLKIAKGYNSVELEAVARLLSTTVIALEDNPDQDFLGELYMSLELGNSNTGQFFTPYCVGKMMAEMNVDKAISDVERNGYASVMDCCVGGGALLLGFANACKEKGLNYQQSVVFVAQDIDHTVGMMAYIQLSLMGCPGYVVIGNSLTEPLQGDPLFAPMERETYVTPFYCSEEWRTKRLLHALGIAKIANSKTPCVNHSKQAEELKQEKIYAPIQLSIFDTIEQGVKT